LKKVKKNLSRELQHANIATKMKVTKVRAKPKTIHTADINASDTLHDDVGDVTNSVF